MKKMKFFRGLTLATLLAVSTLAPTTLFAAETVRVNGYKDEGLEQDQLEISNVTQKLDLTTLEISESEGFELLCDGGFVVTSSSMVKILDECSFVSIVKIQKAADGYQILDPVKLTEGQVKIYANASAQTGEKLVSAKDFDSNSYSETPIYQAGTGAKLTQPGEYLVSIKSSDLVYSTIVYVKVVGTTPSEKPSLSPSKPALPQLKPTASNVLVNGQAFAFEAYNINDSNYFKLRDLAYALNTCNIAWDAQTQAIALVPGVPYEATGSELATGDGQAKNGQETDVKIKKGDATYTLKGYNINDNNYIKVRDVETLLDMTVGYDQATNTLTITSH